MRFCLFSSNFSVFLLILGTPGSASFTVGSYSFGLLSLFSLFWLDLTAVGCLSLLLLDPFLNLTLAVSDCCSSIYPSLSSLYLSMASLSLWASSRSSFCLRICMDFLFILGAASFMRLSSSICWALSQFCLACFCLRKFSWSYTKVLMSRT